MKTLKSTDALEKITGRFRLRADDGTVWRIEHMMLKNSTQELQCECKPKRFLKLFICAKGNKT